MSKKSKKQIEIWKEPNRKYDFIEKNNDYLLAEGQTIPDVYLYPEWRRDTLLKLGDMDMLTGKALLEYNDIIQGGHNADKK